MSVLDIIQLVTNESHQASDATEMDTGGEQETQVLCFLIVYWNISLGLSKRLRMSLNRFSKIFP